MNMFKYFTMMLAIPVVVFGEVNTKNGNFSISYSDMEVSGNGGSIEIRRTYNSKFSGKGWFGYGWGSYYETKLTVSADGSVVVRENGSGAKTRYTPKTPVDSTPVAEKIVAVMNGGKLPPVAKRKMLKKLKENAEMLHSYAKQFNITANISSGTQFTSNLEVITALKSGYRREKNDGSVENFDKEGRLVSVVYKNGIRVEVSLSGRKETSDIY